MTGVIETPAVIHPPPPTPAHECSTGCLHCGVCGRVAVRLLVTVYTDGGKSAPACERCQVPVVI